MQSEDSITSNTKEFPEAGYLPKYSDNFLTQYGKHINILIAEGIRPVPERIAALLSSSSEGRYVKKRMDQACSATEGLLYVNLDEHADYEKTPPLTELAVIEALQKNSANREWIQNALERTARRYDLSLSSNIIHGSKQLLNFLYREISLWEADSFPLDIMMDLTNQYDWTFRSDVWSLREQLRRESLIIHAAWKKLLSLSCQHPLFLILNQSAPTDYFCSAFPQETSLFVKKRDQNDWKILVYTRVKIASSEHRKSLRNTSEGDALEYAVELARALQRIPVLCDLSRRRFPRSFLRVVRFAQYKKWGVRPLGKLSDSSAISIPQTKSCSGFPVLSGHPELFLFDPWPISDMQIVPNLSQDIIDRFVTTPQTKPWQDDRIGARNELEMDECGNYCTGTRSWILPASGGWMRVHDLFKSRMARFLRGFDSSFTHPE
ncbi:MAG: hypothetical protein D3916_09040 [Candidatus Electrothrix sp. MAN1_4]|nr:hypothetical protein [Candidatus Electrothrix sp. MAN1_4]